VKVPSDAQAELLRLIAESEESIEWRAATSGLRDCDCCKPSKARLYIERIDRERNRASFAMATDGRLPHRVVTVEACIRHGWLSNRHQRTVHLPATKLRPAAQDWELHQLDLTEDGLIAFGVWRERKLKSPPPPAPTLTEREREIAELASRAIELGYCLAPREPARKEARRLRREGWFNGCWIANSAYGLVPTGLTVCEINPDNADAAPEQEATAEGMFV
jgi:hypothetical protein